MVGVLASEGLLDVVTPTGGGNRRQVRLTDKGEVQVGRSSRALAGSTQTLLERSGVDAAAYLRDTRRLIGTLAAKEA